MTRARNETKALTATVKEQPLGDPEKDSREPSRFVPFFQNGTGEVRPALLTAGGQRRIDERQPEPNDGKRRSGRSLDDRAETVRLPEARCPHRGLNNHHDDDDGRNAPRPGGNHGRIPPGRANDPQLLADHQPSAVELHRGRQS